jgi:glycosyltransferase involved in cell wall biosynthesis
MNKPFASLCILAWKRPGMLWDCIKSIQETADFPYEIIVNLDGADYTENMSNIMQLFADSKISKVIFSAGLNRGVGRSFQNCIGLAEGEYIFKIDGDLVFKKGWLSKAVSILTNHNTVSAVSLFNYSHYDPQDSRFLIENDLHDCYIVNDFVSSVFGFKKERLLISGRNLFRERDKIPDDGLHIELATTGKLAITKEDYVTNNGFGLGRSVYVIADEKGNPTTQPMYDEPLIFS